MMLLFWLSEMSLGTRVVTGMAGRPWVLFLAPPDPPTEGSPGHLFEIMVAQDRIQSAASAALLERGPVA